METNNMSEATARGVINRAAILAVIELLAERWPQTFAVYERRRKPLKVGINADLCVALAGAVTVQELGAALRYYTRNPVYQANLITGAERYGLDGQAAGTVAPEHATGDQMRDAYRSRVRAERPRAEHARSTANPTGETQPDVATLTNRPKLSLPTKANGRAVLGDATGEA